MLITGVSKADLEQWLVSPISERVFRVIRDKRDTIAHELGGGSFLDKENPYRTQANAFEKSGAWNAYNNVLNLEGE